jgi:hypothetical protein
VGLEVDLLLDEPEGLLPIEIKTSATVTDDLFKGLGKWLAVAGDATWLPRLVCAVPTSYERNGSLWPWWMCQIVSRPSTCIGLKAEATVEDRR